MVGTGTRLRDDGSCFLVVVAKVLDRRSWNSKGRRAFTRTDLLRDCPHVDEGLVEGRGSLFSLTSGRLPVEVPAKVMYRGLSDLSTPPCPYCDASTERIGGAWPPVPVRPSLARLPPRRNRADRPEH